MSLVEIIMPFTEEVGSSRKGPYRQTRVLQTFICVCQIAVEPRTMMACEPL